MLDVPSITFLSNYLAGYPSTVLVVSHDRAFLNEVATDIIHQHSERLDYYKGANFGKRQCSVNEIAVLTQDQILSTPRRRSVGKQQSESMITKWSRELIFNVRTGSL